jgi:enamine deaminase RidA (YjgF/YER057c/UK114 family)
MPQWVQAATGGGTRYLHQSGAQVQVFQDGRVIVDRGITSQARRATSEIEDWLVHAGYQWHSGTHVDRTAEYRPANLRGEGHRSEPADLPDSTRE